MKNGIVWKPIAAVAFLGYVIFSSYDVFAAPIIRLMVIPEELSANSRPLRNPKPPSLELVERVEEKLRPLLDDTYKLIPAREVINHPEYEVKMPFVVSAVSFAEKSQQPLQVMVKVSLVAKKEPDPASPRGRKKRTVYRLEGEIKNLNPAQTVPFAISVEAAQKKKGKWRIVGLEGACMGLVQNLEGSIKPLYSKPEKNPHELVKAEPPKVAVAAPVADPETRRLVSEDVQPAVSTVVRPTRVSQNFLALPAYVLAEQENPLLVKKEKPKESLPWWPLFDIRLGYARNSRRFTVNDVVRFPGTAPSSFGGTNGLFLLAELYPLAYVSRLPVVLSGLGLQYTYSKSFWDPIRTIDPNGMLLRQADTDEWRMEGALHWHLNLANKAWIPMLELDGLYGYHTFTLTPTDTEKASLPSVAYHYAGGRVGIRCFLSRWVELGGRWMGTKLLQLGEGITSSDYYGTGDGWMWRAEGELTFHIKGIIIGSRVWYERKELTFDGNGQPQQFLPSSASARNVLDESLYFMVTLGYRFAPTIHSRK